MNYHPNDNVTVKKDFDAFNGIERDLSPQGLFALAYWYDDSNQTDDALRLYQLALDADPGLAEAHYNMAVIYKEMQDQKKAVFNLERAIHLKPYIAESYSTLSMIWYEQHRYEEALVLLDQAVTIKPQFAEAHFHMGLILQEMGEYQPGLKCFEKALACNPDLMPARWRYLLSLPMVYDTAEQIDSLRQRFGQNLDLLIQSISLETPIEIQSALQGVRTATNFYLQYQGRNDVDLQQKYGRLVCDVMSARYPQWRHCNTRQTPQPGKAIRIGYVSSFMCHHTIGTFLSGWVENHDPVSFRIHCYHVGQKIDDMTTHFKNISHHYYHLPGDVEAAANQIASDELDILVYSDIGMTMETLQLAALRLAPIQCKGWGHPVTTGLPTIDYYLSSDLMEPEKAEKYYSEVLVRLPNIALCYQPPQIPSKPKSRKALGIPEDRFIFLSPQSIYKYLPQHDDIYPMVAREVPHAYFVFISHHSRHATQRFRLRLRNAFDKHGLDIDRYCYFSPRLGMNEFLSLNKSADVLLDTFEWSGGKTTLEAISCGLPVVTCPGRFMRGRHAFAMLTMMGACDTIARNRSEYAQIAIRLATDSIYYEKISKRIKAHRHKLYGDKWFISELERFYRSAVQHRPDTPSLKEPHVKGRMKEQIIHHHG